MAGGLTSSQDATAKQKWMRDREEAERTDRDGKPNPPDLAGPEGLPALNDGGERQV